MDPISTRNGFLESFHSKTMEDFVNFVYDTFVTILIQNYGGLYTRDGVDEQTFSSAGVFEKCTLFRNVFNQSQGITQDVAQNRFVVEAGADGNYITELGGTVDGDNNENWEIEVRVNGTTVIGEGSAITENKGPAPITYAAESVALVEGDVIEMFVAPENNNEALRFEDVTFILRTAVA